MAPSATAGRQWGQSLTGDGAPRSAPRRRSVARTAARSRSSILSRLTGDLISSPQYIYADDYQTERHDSAYWRTLWMDEISNDLMLDLEE